MPVPSEMLYLYEAQKVKANNITKIAFLNRIDRLLNHSISISKKCLPAVANYCSGISRNNLACFRALWIY